MQLILTYWGTSHVLTIFTPHHRNDNDINPLAVFIIFNSVISLTREFKKPTIKSTRIVCYQWKSIRAKYLITVFINIRPFVSIIVLWNVFKNVQDRVSIRSIKTVTFYFSNTISSGVKSLSHITRKRFTSYSPAAYASANSWSLSVSKSITNTFSSWSIVSCFGDVYRILWFKISLFILF